MKSRYPEGTRIKLLHMGNDPNPVHDNSKGTVSFVDDIGTVFVDFDNGRSIGLIYGEDNFCIINEWLETRWEISGLSYYHFDKTDLFDF